MLRYSGAFAASRALYGIAVLQYLSNTCQNANDGRCDDGGVGSEYSLCNLGTDCNVRTITFRTSPAVFCTVN